MNVAQCRMARAALDWSIGDLADAAELDQLSVKRFENGDPLLPFKVEALRKAFEAKGVRFVMSGPFEGAVVPPGPQAIPAECNGHALSRGMNKAECSRLHQFPQGVRGGMI